MQLLIPILLFGFLYVLLIRPQQQRVRRQQALLSSVEVGDEVVTAGGIIGRVTRMENDRMDIEVAPGVTLNFVRGAITRILEPEAPEEADEQPPDAGTDGMPGEGLG